jgi:glycosyltransferase involved in cell wall biosynthesis
VKSAENNLPIPTAQNVRSNWLSLEYQAGLVSVIIPVYNRQDLIGRALESILTQTYRPLEMVVVNDGSTDQSSKVIHTFKERVQQHSGLTMIVVNTENSGGAAARNAGLHVSTGEYLAFLDSDDHYDSFKIEKQVQAMKAHTDWSFCYGPVKPEAEQIGGTYGASSLVWREVALRQIEWPYFSTLGPLITRRLMHDMGPWNETLSSCQDWELFTRMIMLHPAYGWVGDAFAYYRVEGMGSADRSSVSDFKRARNQDASAIRCRACQLLTAQHWMHPTLQEDSEFNRSFLWEVLKSARTHYFSQLSEESESLFEIALSNSHDITAQRWLTRMKKCRAFLGLRLSWELFGLFEYFYFKLRGLQRRMHGPVCAVSGKE